MLKFFAKGVNYLLGKQLHKSKLIIANSLEYLDRNRGLDANYFDAVRLSTLELLSYEINTKQLKGNVAELGVYKGKFARFINQLFPDRILYLFDTFEGFDKRDTEKEIKENYSTGTQDFSDTSVECVLKLMPHPQKCKPVVGFFPDSAIGLDDQFVLVSLDADLYEPIYNGLKYFYPRLAKGGYIMIHDFNNEGYKGARKAVEQFCEEEGIGYLPIPDSCGSAIVAK